MNLPPQIDDLIVPTLDGRAKLLNLALERDWLLGVTVNRMLSVALGYRSLARLIVVVTEQDQRRLANLCARERDEKKIFLSN